MASFTTRPIIMGTRGVVAAGHYVAAAAGFRAMTSGGNAIDAAAVMCFCLNILRPSNNGIGGEVPTLVYSAREKKVYAVSGMGWSPRAFTIDWCRQHKIDLIPGDGFLPATVPAVVDTWATAVARFGTMSFSQVLQPAMELAENGFPVHDSLHRFLAGRMSEYPDRYPTTAEVYLPGGRAPEPGSILRNPDWAKTLKTMCRAEAGARHMGRIAGIEAARDAFYKGEIAERIADFISNNPVEDATGKSHAGLLSYEDMADWHATVEAPVSYHFRGLDVHKCPPWTQGPTFLQHLAILDGYDMRKLGHNSADYLHTWIEAAKLAFADREAYYGDPAFDDVPLDTLLSEEYSLARRDLIGGEASMQLRPGDVGDGAPSYATFDVAADNRRALGLVSTDFMDLETRDPHASDTVHLDAVDAQGNMVSATPSGGWLGDSPIIKGLGFPLGTRGQMFYLNPARPNALVPHKRPRATLTPSLVTRDGRPFMVFGTPGGDAQEQITLQFFLNHVVFDMNIQEAIEAPTVYIHHFPNSFYPRTAYPGQVSVESRIPADVVSALQRRGHKVEMTEAWRGGEVTGIRYDSATGVISGGASPNGGLTYAIGW